MKRASVVVAIGVFIRDRDMGSVVLTCRKAPEREVPQGYSITWSGSSESGTGHAASDAGGVFVYPDDLYSILMPSNHSAMP